MAMIVGAGEAAGVGVASCRRRLEDAVIVARRTWWRDRDSTGFVGGQLARRGFYNDADRCSGKFMRM